ncbi:hypothetical protein CAXC1_330100 [Candidatus Xenohaliotis californiensis]|uniref:Uncharacterized protein n=1 Tax=Candidatus Xenohaliotis californiensis TaxID=84677 RepID=A0ABM9N8V2_9RICK|nr:hypothetical protein CAXC1_330100 [Candidatus Xenohaliotis californiensis]
MPKKTTQQLMYSRFASGDMQSKTTRRVSALEFTDEHVSKSKDLLTKKLESSTSTEFLHTLKKAEWHFSSIMSTLQDAAAKCAIDIDNLVSSEKKNVAEQAQIIESFAATGGNLDNPSHKILKDKYNMDDASILKLKKVTKHENYCVQPAASSQSVNLVLRDQAENDKFIKDYQKCLKEADANLRDHMFVPLGVIIRRGRDALIKKGLDKSNLITELAKLVAESKPINANPELTVGGLGVQIIDKKTKKVCTDYRQGGPLLLTAKKITENEAKKMLGKVDVDASVDLEIELYVDAFREFLKEIGASELDAYNLDDLDKSLNGTDYETSGKESTLSTLRDDHISCMPRMVRIKDIKNEELLQVAREYAKKQEDVEYEYYTTNDTPITSIDHLAIKEQFAGSLLAEHVSAINSAKLNNSNNFNQPCLHVASEVKNELGYKTICKISHSDQQLSKENLTFQPVIINTVRTLPVDHVKNGIDEDNLVETTYSITNKPANGISNFLDSIDMISRLRSMGMIKTSDNFLLDPSIDALEKYSVNSSDTKNIVRISIQHGDKKTNLNVVKEVSDSLKSIFGEDFHIALVDKDKWTFDLKNSPKEENKEKVYKNIIGHTKESDPFAILMKCADFATTATFLGTVEDEILKAIKLDETFEKAQLKEYTLEIVKQIRAQSATYNPKNGKLCFKLTLPSMPSENAEKIADYLTENISQISTECVETDSGRHVIKFTAKNNLPVPNFTEHENLYKFLTDDEESKFLVDLSKNYQPIIYTEVRLRAQSEAEKTAKERAEKPVAKERAEKAVAKERAEKAVAKERAEKPVVAKKENSKKIENEQKLDELSKPMLKLIQEIQKTDKKAEDKTEDKKTEDKKTEEAKELARIMFVLGSHQHVKLSAKDTTEKKEEKDEGISKEMHSIMVDITHLAAEIKSGRLSILHRVEKALKSLLLTFEKFFRIIVDWLNTPNGAKILERIVSDSGCTLEEVRTNIKEYIEEQRKNKDTSIGSMSETEYKALLGVSEQFFAYEKETIFQIIQQVSDVSQDKTKSLSKAMADNFVLKLNDKVMTFEELLDMAVNTPVQTNPVQETNPVQTNPAKETNPAKAGTPSTKLTEIAKAPAVNTTAATPLVKAVA